MRITESAAIVLKEEVLESEDLKGVPLLVLSNKSDLNGILTEDEVQCCGCKLDGWKELFK